MIGAQSCQLIKLIIKIVNICKGNVRGLSFILLNVVALILQTEENGCLGRYAVGQEWGEGRGTLWGKTGVRGGGHCEARLG